MFCTVLFTGITITTLLITRVSPILIALCVGCTKNGKSTLFNGLNVKLVMYITRAKYRMKDTMKVYI